MMDLPELPQWVIGLAGVAGGIVSTVAVAFFKRDTDLRNVVTESTKVLIEGYEKRIEELTDHIKRLEGKIERLEERLIGLHKG